MNISELYGKKVESTAGKKGYVISVNAYDGLIEGLICADENEEEFAVDVKSIVKAGDKIVFEDRETAIKRAKPLRLGRAGYDAEGKYLGLVEEFISKGAKITGVKIGAKKYPMQSVVLGDAAIVKSIKRLKSDVVKDGKVIIKRGTAITDEVLSSAAEQGEYVQTSLKSL